MGIEGDLQLFLGLSASKMQKTGFLPQKDQNMGCFCENVTIGENLNIPRDAPSKKNMSHVRYFLEVRTFSSFIIGSPINLNNI